MIHRSFLSLLFAILLVFAQQAAISHPYVHTADLQQKSQNDKQYPSHSEVCGQCVAFADVESTLSSKSQALNFTHGQYELATVLTTSFAAVQLLSYHSRAPPSLA